MRRTESARRVERVEGVGVLGAGSTADGSVNFTRLAVAKLILSGEVGHPGGAECKVEGGVAERGDLE
jgi:hypothetical protein